MRCCRILSLSVLEHAYAVAEHLARYYVSPKPQCLTNNGKKDEENIAAATYIPANRRTDAASCRDNKPPTDSDQWIEPTFTWRW
jgi:hypothetical protein